MQVEATPVAVSIQRSKEPLENREHCKVSSKAQESHYSSLRPVLVKGCQPYVGRCSPSPSSSVETRRCVSASLLHLPLVSNEWSEVSANEHPDAYERHRRLCQLTPA